MTVEWVEDLPERERGRQGRWARICDELRMRPGHWARVHTGNNTAYATMLKQGKLGNCEPGEFEAESRKNENGGYDIFARYVGVPEAEPEKMNPVGLAFPAFSPLAIG